MRSAAGLSSRATLLRSDPSASRSVRMRPLFGSGAPEVDVDGAAPRSRRAAAVRSRSAGWRTASPARRPPRRSCGSRPYDLVQAPVAHRAQPLQPPARPRPPTGAMRGPGSDDRHRQAGRDDDEDDGRCGRPRLRSRARATGHGGDRLLPRLGVPGQLGEPEDHDEHAAGGDGDAPQQRGLEDDRRARSDEHRCAQRPRGPRRRERGAAHPTPSRSGSTAGSATDAMPPAAPRPGRR